MDKVLKDFYEEKKRKHLEYLGLYKNCDEQVSKINKEIEEIERPLYDLKILEKLIDDIKQDKYKYEGCEHPDYELIVTFKEDFCSRFFIYDIDTVIDILLIIYNIQESKKENRFNLSENNFIDLKKDIKRKSLEHPFKIINQETEEEAYDFIVSIQKDYIKSIKKSINTLRKKYDKYYEINNALKKVQEAFNEYKLIKYNQILQWKTKIRKTLSPKQYQVLSGSMPINPFLKKFITCSINSVINNNETFINESEDVRNKLIILNKIYGRIYNYDECYRDFISLKKEIKRNDWIIHQENKETEEEAYDFIVAVQKEYIESIMESTNLFCEKYGHLSFFKTINDILKGVYDSLSNYVPIKFDQIPQYRTKISGLKEEISRNYQYDNGHWYSKFSPKYVIEISSSDYDELCKKYPPYLMDIEGFVQETYKNGYDKGHKNGYDEGYSDGYDEGY